MPSPALGALLSETRQAGGPSLSSDVLDRAAFLDRTAAELTHNSVLNFINTPAQAARRSVQAPAYVPPVQRDQLAAVRAPPPQAPNAGLFFGSLARVAHLPAPDAELDGRPLGHQSVQRHEQRLHARLNSLSEQQLSRLDASLPPRLRRQLHVQLEAAHVTLPSIKPRNAAAPNIRASKSTPALCTPMPPSTRPPPGRLPSLPGYPALPNPPSGNKRADGYAMARSSAQGPTASSQILPMLPPPPPCKDEIHLLTKTVESPMGGCWVFLEIDVPDSLGARQGPAPASSASAHALGLTVEDAEAEGLPPQPLPASPPASPPAGCVAKLTTTAIKRSSGDCHVRLEIALYEPDAPYSVGPSIQQPSSPVQRAARVDGGRSPHRSPHRSPQRSPASACIQPKTGHVDSEHAWRPPRVDATGRPLEEALLMLRHSLCRCAGRALEHFTALDTRSTGSLSRSEFHSGVHALELNVPTAVIDRLFDLWAAPSTLLSRAHGPHWEHATYDPADRLALTDLSGALKRGGAPRHVRAAAAAHKRIHRDQPIRQSELLQSRPALAQAAATAPSLLKRRPSFGSFLLDGANASRKPVSPVAAVGGSSGGMLSAVRAFGAAGAMQSAMQSAGVKRLRLAVKRMKVREDAKAELMTLIGQWSADKLHLLEALFQNAEFLQMQMAQWIEQRPSVNKGGMNSHEIHELLKHLQLSMGTSERERALLSNGIFDQLDSDQSGYVSLDELSLAMWQSANQEIWRLYQDLRASAVQESKTSTADGIQRRLESPEPGEVADHLRSALVDQAQRVIDLFQSWDQDGDGTITKAEFRRALPELGLWANPEDVDQLFDSFDTDGGGSISFRELNRMLRRTRHTDERKTTKKAEVVMEVADVGVLRKEIFKQVRAAALHAGIDHKLNAADAPAAEGPLA